MANAVIFHIIPWYGTPYHDQSPHGTPSYYRMEYHLTLEKAYFSGFQKKRV